MMSEIHATVLPSIILLDCTAPPVIEHLLVRIDSVLFMRGDIVQGCAWLGQSKNIPKKCSRDVWRISRRVQSSSIAAPDKNKSSSYRPGG